MCSSTDVNIWNKSGRNGEYMRWFGYSLYLHLFPAATGMGSLGLWRMDVLGVLL